MAAIVRGFGVPECAFAAMTSSPNRAGTVVAPQRKLEVRHAVAVCVGMVIGAGIFKTSPLVAANVSSDAMLFVAWALGGFLSLVGALCFAELATAFPDAGGDYYFLRRAYGDRMGFVFAWSRFAVIHTGSMALLAFVFGDYLAQVIDLGRYGSAQFAIIVIVTLVVLNLRGIKVGVGTQLGLMSLVMFGLFCVGAAGLSLSLSGLPAPLPGPSSTGGAAAFGVAMVFVFLAFGGWSDAATLSAEMRDSRRGMVFALIGGLGAVTALYLMVNWAFWRGLGLSGLAASNAPAADLMRLAFGRSGEFLIVTIVAITSITVMNALMIAGARTTYAAARDHPTLRRLGEWDLDKGVPPVALLAQGTVALALVGFGTLTRGGFETMVDYLSPVYWFFLVLSGFAVIRLRRKYPDMPRPFRVPLYPWLPLLFCASSAYVLYSSLVYVKLGAVVGVVVLLIGAALLPLIDRRSTT